MGRTMEQTSSSKFNAGNSRLCGIWWGRYFWKGAVTRLKLCCVSTCLLFCLGDQPCPGVCDLHMWVGLTQGERQMPIKVSTQLIAQKAQHLGLCSEANSLKPFSNKLLLDFGITEKRLEEILQYRLALKAGTFQDTCEEPQNVVSLLLRLPCISCSLL